VLPVSEHAGTSHGIHSFQTLYFRCVTHTLVLRAARWPSNMSCANSRPGMSSLLAATATTGAVEDSHELELRAGSNRMSYRGDDPSCPCVHAVASVEETHRVRNGRIRLRVCAANSVVAEFRDFERHSTMPYR